MFWILIYLWLIAQKMTEVNVSLNNLEPMECSLNDEPQNEPSVNDDQEAEEDEDGNPFEAKKRKKNIKSMARVQSCHSQRWRDKSRMHPLQR